MKLGILGGTFNPIHNAHIQMAEIARDALGLDRVLLMVAADPPHKCVDGQVPAQRRLAMARLAAEGLNRIEASDLEIRRGGKSYMSDTLAALHVQHPAAELYLIVGSDMLADLKTWHCPKLVAQRAAIAAIARHGREAHDAQAAQELKERFGARVLLLGGNADPLSSTRIRERLAAGLPVETMLPAAVERDCYEQGTYFPPDVQRMQRRLRAVLTPKRYVHTMGVVRTAAALAARWGVDPQAARTAALLHDCAKYLDPVMLEVLGGDDTGIASVQHAFAGAVVAKNVYDVQDEAVLRAIRLHSTGDAGMTMLDKATYLADLTEPNRNFPCVETMREFLSLGADYAMYRSLLRTRAYVEQMRNQGENDAFHPAGERALAYFEAVCAAESGQAPDAEA